MNGVLVGSVAVLFVALGAVLVVAVRRRNWSAVVNAVASLAVAVVAGAGATGFQFTTSELVTPSLALWAAAAGFFHAIGMLGPYESVWWWDHVTHALSAALLAALVYAGILVTVGTNWSTVLVAAATVGYVALAGVFWELVELLARAVGERYDVEPVLVHYGPRDTALDLVFDVIGAVIVAVLDVRLFVALFDTAPAVTRLLLRWTAIGILVGSVVMGIGLLWRRKRTST